MFDTHWIPLHRGNIGPWTDADVFRQWRPPTVKIVWDGVKIPYLEDVPPSSKILWRNYQLSVQFDGGLDLGGVRSLSGEPEAPPVIGVNGLPQNGSGKDRQVRAMNASSASGQPTPEQAAESYVNNAVEIAAYALTQGIAQEWLLFEGPNEYPVWAHGYSGLARLEKRRLQLMHQRLPQAGCVVSNLGVGWPGNTGPDTPPVWDWFAPVAATMGNRDYLGAHEYCGLNGIMENWGWWLGRILKCPYKVPMLITEYGPPDGGVYGASHAKQGWRNYPGMASEDAKAERCIEEMYRYAAVIGADGRVRELCQYTYDGHGEDWGNFDIRTETFLRPFLARLQAEGLPNPGPFNPRHPPPVTPPTFDDLRNVAWNALFPPGGVAYLPDAAFAKYARLHELGAPVTNEGRFGGYAFQGYAAHDPVRVEGDWGNVKRLPW